MNELKILIYQLIGGGFAAGVLTALFFIIFILLCKELIEWKFKK